MISVLSTVCLVITENKVLEIEFYSWNFFCFNAIVEMYYVLCIMYYVLCIMYYVLCIMYLKKN